MQNLANNSTIVFEPSLAKKERLETAEMETTEFHFQLSNALQSSLDVKATLEHFFRVVESHTSISGCDYTSCDSEERLRFGSKRAHSANYKLSVGDEQIGQLCFYARNKLSETELKTLEVFLGLLVTPLRNALRYKKAIEQSLTDELTGVGNRAAMNCALRRELCLTQRHESPLSVLIVDIDYFKAINDQYGHLFGDQVLAKTAQLLKTALRETDQVFRYGGEEFVILLGDTAHMDALAIADRIRLTISGTNFHSTDRVFKTSVSIGVATTSGSQAPEDILKKADGALYEAKAQGRNRVISAKQLVFNRLSNFDNLNTLQQPF